MKEAAGGFSGNPDVLTRRGARARACIEFMKILRGAVNDQVNIPAFLDTATGLSVTEAWRTKMFHEISEPFSMPDWHRTVPYTRHESSPITFSTPLIIATWFVGN